VVTERSTVVTVVLSKSFSDFRLGPVTSETATGPENCLSSRSKSAARDWSVDGVDDQLAVVECGGNVQVRHLVEAPGLVLGDVDEELQGFAFAVVGEQCQRMVDGLQIDALVIAEDGCDDVDQLRHVGDFDDVRVVDEGVEEGGDHQRVLEVVWVPLGGAPESAASMMPLPL
jgi:hypothetical protein